MIDHLSLAVTDYERARAFYSAALRPLGYVMLLELARSETPNSAVGRSCCFGDRGLPELWLNEVERVLPIHLAFRTERRAVVDAFHAAALAAGGTDHGAPGVRPAPYPEGYYAAFVLDPGGHNIEVVCRQERRLQHEVEQVDFPGARVAVLEGLHDPQPHDDAVRRFIAWRVEHGVPPSVSATYNIVHGDPAQGPLRFDLCAVIEAPVEPNAYGVVEGQIAAGRCAVLRQVRGEAALGPAIHHLYAEWLPQSGVRLRDAPLFFHRVRLGPDPITDIYLPLA
jgi:DNA gyrase inhibitor GyrI/catechol 2,3-dioxygenase-like lactoylglutathione lyase family enzyme